MAFGKIKIRKGFINLLTYFFIISAIIVIYYNFSYKPSHSIIKSKIENEFRYNMALKSYLIDNELSKYIEGAKSISSRSMIRNKIVDYKNNKISIEELSKYTTPKYHDGINALDACTYAVRYVDGEAIVEFGDSTGSRIKSILPDTALNKLKAYLNARDSNFLVSTISPIVDNDKTLGYDITYSKSSNILNIIEETDEEFDIIEQNKKNTTKRQKVSIEFSKDTLVYEEGVAYYLYKSKFSDATYRFSKSQKIIYKELKNFNRKQFFVLSLLSISIILIIYIIQHRVKLFYFKRSYYLEGLVAEKTSELNNAIEELKSTNNFLQKSESQLMESNKTKDKFFSIIAHDLINPFSSMLGFLEVLNTNYDNYDKPKQKKLLGFLFQEMQNTYSLLDNLLSWSHSHRGKLKFVPQNLEISKIAEEVIDGLSLQASQKSISIKNNIDDNLIAYGDKNMLLTIIRNLISNAIKFTNNSGKIEINAVEIVNEDSQKQIQVSVKDNGIGIQPERISKLFSVSENKSTKGTEKEIGTGLGLILCKEFIDRHNGKIWAESKLNEGSSFIFNIPAENTEA